MSTFLPLKFHFNDTSFRDLGCLPSREACWCVLQTPARLFREEGGGCKGSEGKSSGSHAG